MGFFDSVRHVGKGALKVVGKIGGVVKKVGHFALQNHQAITGLAHAAALASGHQGAIDATGAAVGLSTLATQANNALSGHIANMRQAHAAPPRVATGYPVGKAG